MNTSQQNVVTAQELQQIGFSQDIQLDPASYQAYVNQNVDKLMNETLQRKQNAFQKTLTDTGRYMDMDHNAQLYQTRSSDISKLQKVIRDVNTKYEASNDSNKKLTRRQFEINEWAYNNKLETLFLLQILFISMLVLVLSFFLAKNGYISTTAASSLAILLFVVIAYIGYRRWDYTKYTRDTRLWSRRSFPAEEGGAKQTNGHCDAQGNYVIDLKNIIPDIVTQNAESVQETMQRVFNNIDAQATAYQTGTSIPTNSCPTPPPLPPPISS
jgi:uncharacterized protein YggL (DUF469 family)